MTGLAIVKLVSLLAPLGREAVDQIIGLVHDSKRRWRRRLADEFEAMAVSIDEKAVSEEDAVEAAYQSGRAKGHRECARMVDDDAREEDI